MVIKFPQRSFIVVLPFIGTASDSSYTCPSTSTPINSSPSGGYAKSSLGDEGSVTINGNPCGIKIYSCQLLPFRPSLFVSIIILYLVLSTRYGYKSDEIERIITFVYFFKI